jgi:hypothetical protein
MWPWRTPPNSIRPFYLHRIVDASGVSGTGVVAVGVVLPSGKAVLEWCSRWKTVTIFESVHQIERIHGHGGRTILHWGLPPKEPKPASFLELLRYWAKASRPVDASRILRALPPAFRQHDQP